MLTFYQKLVQKMSFLLWVFPLSRFRSVFPVVISPESIFIAPLRFFLIDQAAFWFYLTNWSTLALLDDLWQRCDCFYFRDSLFTCVMRILLLRVAFVCFPFWFLFGVFTSSWARYSIVLRFSWFVCHINHMSKCTKCSRFWVGCVCLTFPFLGKTTLIFSCLFHNI